MQHAIHLAKNARFTARPNPMVGAVVVKNNNIIAEGYHLAPGEPHAEVNALTKLNDDLSDATLYVTLEPCSVTGRTPPCAPYVVKKKLARVVMATDDPNPLVNGKGRAMLQQAGIPVTGGVLAEKAQHLNAGYFSHHQRNRPFIRAKQALSLDAKIALANGASKWITGSAARADVHYHRARSCAILTGINTVLKDDPQLNVRDVDIPLNFKQPVKIILDRTLKMPPSAKLFTDNAPVIIFTENNDEKKIKNLEHHTNTKIIVGHYTLDEIVHLIAKEKINDILLEAGPTLFDAFLKANLIDEMILYYAPKILGQQALTGFLLNSPSNLFNVKQFKRVSVSQMGEDIKIILN